MCGGRCPRVGTRQHISFASKKVAASGVEKGEGKNLTIVEVGINLSSLESTWKIKRVLSLNLVKETGRELEVGWEYILQQ